MPDFLKPESARIAVLDDEDAGEDGDGARDIVQGLTLTGYFLQHWVFAHHSNGIPDARMRLQAIITKESSKQVA